ncbi:MAG TPA: hypothetical protein VEB40_14460 [Flavipsychrobacter sp.]|nr:hypothetical protein [Flavipsychrobacter sp.]
MPLIEEKFDQSRIDSIRRYLQREKDKGRAKDYEIVIDGFKVVSRTDNLDEFEDYEQELKNSTRNISILVYDGPNTNRNTRYSLLLQGEPSVPASKGLNGLGEIDQIIQERLDAKEKEFELKQLREKLTETQQALEEAEDYADELETKIEELREARLLQSKNWGEVLSGFLSAATKDSNSPVGKALAGLLGVEQNARPIELQGSKEETEASYERSQPELSEEMKNHIAIIAQIQQSFDPNRKAAVLFLLDYYCKYPEKLDETIKFLNIQNDN